MGSSIKDTLNSEGAYEGDKGVLPTAEKLFQSALAAHHRNDLSSARQYYEAVLRLEPEDISAMCNLGSVLRRQNETDAAIRLLQKAVQHYPNAADVVYNLGNALRDGGFLKEAMNAFQHALRIKPDFAGAYYNLGIVSASLGLLAEAELAYRQALQYAPLHYEAALNLGSLLENQGYLGEAINLYRQCTVNVPDRAAAWNNLGVALQNAGRAQDAVFILQKAFQLEPGERVASNILMAMQYHPEMSELDLLAAARVYGRRFQMSHGMVRVPLEGRPLRIGFVSSDLCSHPVGLFLRAVLRKLDPMRVEPYCYNNSKRKDDVTMQLAAVSQWREIAGLSDDVVFKTICDDGIDVLVDLSGHTAGNRLPVFARRAAPLQVSWLGYFATTGLAEIDAVMMDAWHVPPESELIFSERVLRLPHTRFCYSPVEFAPQVSPSPCLRNGFITFGSFNNTAKLNDQVLDVWSRVLCEVPNSRLILKWRTFADVEFQRELLGRFANLGISPDRIELRSQSVHRELLEQYADVDISLDPFPFSGGHTSCEGLWMGVPIVTFPGARPVSRQTLCFIGNLGQEDWLDEWVAGSAEDYVTKAAALAGDVAKLVAIRSRLRGVMRTSPLLDAEGFARDFESAIMTLWHEKKQ